MKQTNVWHKVIVGIILCTFFLKINAIAQENHVLKGKIIDTISSQPLAFATVRIFDSSNTELKALISDAQGMFSIKQSLPNIKRILISFTGYESKDLNIDSFMRLNGDLGLIKLKADSLMLKQVVVTALAPLIKQDKDKLEYNVQADDESKVENALTILRKVPFVSVDPMKIFY